MDLNIIPIHNHRAVQAHNDISAISQCERKVRQ